MTIDLTMADIVWLNDSDVCGIEHLIEVSGLSQGEIEDLVNNDLIVPANAQRPHLFHLHYVMTVKAAGRLKDDFQLDQHGLTLAVTLLKRIDELKAELQALQAQTAHRL